MFQPYYAFIGYRYTRAKRKNHFISFIALTAMIGIALGVAVLITVLSVMNGFGREIRGQMLNGAPHITVQSFDGRGLTYSDNLLREIGQFPAVLGQTPYIQGQGMLSHSGAVQGVSIKGIPLAQRVFPLQQYLIAGDMDHFTAGAFGIYLGKQLAAGLGLQVGDKIALIVPEAQVSLAGVSPRLKRFTLLGIFEMGTFFDSTHAFIHISDAAKLFRYPNHQVSGIQLKVDDELNAAGIANQLRAALGPHYEVFDWMQNNGSYLAAIQMEKTVMTFILLLIVAIAAFNLVSGLVMLVTDKRPDIAILRTLGARAHQIMGVFMVQGSFIGIMGVLIGLVLGVTLALNVTDWAAWIENTFQVRLFHKELYAVTCLPSQLQLSDVLKICSWSLGFSFVSTLYPAYRASKIRPAEALRYE